MQWQNFVFDSAKNEIVLTSVAVVASTTLSLPFCRVGKEVIFLLVLEVILSVFLIQYIHLVKFWVIFQVSIFHHAPLQFLIRLFFQIIVVGSKVSLKKMSTSL